MTDQNYEHSEGQAYCESLGLTWSYELAAFADVEAHANGLNQAEFDYIVCRFCDIQKWQWSPRTWGWRGRIAMAIHFLFNPKGM